MLLLDEMLFLLLFSFSSVVALDGVPPGDVDVAIDATDLPDDDKLKINSNTDKNTSLKISN